jgi:amidohydrolase
VTNNWLSGWVADHRNELIGLRRRIHSRPELAFAEYATTELVLGRLEAARLNPRRLPNGTGLVVDIGSGDRTIAVRADIDALPVPDLKSVPYRSTVEGVCHACGHDAHTAIAVGTALALAEAPYLPGRIRVIFQPAEERMGGARAVINAGELEGVEHVFALHCDAHLPVGQVGLRVGPITAACDLVEVRLTGPGGHTARPHLTVDLVETLSRIAVDAPAMVARRVDARAGLSLVWGAIRAGEAANTIPSTGVLRGTVRVLDHAAWSDAEKQVSSVITDIAAAAGASVHINYERGVPPVVNDLTGVELMRAAVNAELGPSAVASTRTSMGGEDFAWFGEHAPVTMARLGTHSEALSTVRDLHQGNFDIDERALGIGVRVLTSTVLAALADA